MELENIYRPIEKELKIIEKVLEGALKKSKNRTILKISNFLLESPGKRIRPALVILSAKATLNQQQSTISHKLIKIASAIELIHMASLVHDDVIDHSRFRHNRLTINSKWGREVSIALGDYLFSVATELIADCSNPDIIRCISSATRTMSEGELIQVCERDNLDILKERYILIVKKKTASLFAASCHAGSIASNSKMSLQGALRGYGLNFGIAFQIIDDYLDLVGKRRNLGKMPGEDMSMGEITLPLLNLFESINGQKKEELKMLLESKRDTLSLRRIKSQLVNSDAVHRTKETVLSYTALAKKNIDGLPHSPYKEGLFNLADFIVQRGFCG